MLNTSVDKTSYISLDFGFIRLIQRGNNPNKETLIYIPYTSCHHNLSSYNSRGPGPIGGGRAWPGFNGAPAKRRRRADQLKERGRSWLEGGFMVGVCGGRI